MKVLKFWGISGSINNRRFRVIPGSRNNRSECFWGISGSINNRRFRGILGSRSNRSEGLQYVRI
ncbi:hypothetical protein Avbf_06259 [Armadillidium vulgare]|nr:hypothetical protein Avbf_06259 [Armadillidium vulgare]